MRGLRAAAIVLVAATTFAAGVFASPARADWGDGYHHRWHPHDGWGRPGGPPALIVVQPAAAGTQSAADHVPPATSVALPAAAYVPPPVAYAPSPPAYYAPGVAFDLTVR